MRGIAALEFAGSACCKRDTILVCLIAINDFFTMHFFVNMYLPSRRIAITGLPFQLSIILKFIHFEVILIIFNQLSTGMSNEDKA